MGKSVLSRLGWRWFAAVGLFSLAMIGQGLGGRAERAHGGDQRLAHSRVL